MPARTVRGRFELDAPALRTLKELERAGVRTSASMKAVRQDVEKVASAKDRRRLEDYRRSIRGLGTDTRKAHTVSGASWRANTRVVEREVRKQRRAVKGLIGDLELLGAVKATPRVDVDGVGAAIAQVQLLRQQLEGLSRQSAAGRVLGLGGGGGGGGSGGGGGGRSGGGGQGLRSVGVGPFNLGSRLGLGLIGAALPAGTAALGGAGAVLGSAGAGTLGGGALGIAGGGGLAAGAGLSMAVGKPAQTRITEAAKAQQKLTETVREFGAASEEAATARRAFNRSLSDTPRGTGALLRERSSFTSRWRRQTRPGQQDYVGLLRAGIRGGNRILPTAAQAGNRVMGANRREGTNLANRLSGRTGQQFVRSGAAIYDENLGNAEKTLEHLFETWTNIQRASRPYFKEATTFLKEWTGGWARGTRDIKETREDVGKLVEHLKDWGRLGGSTYRLLRDLMSAGAPSGQSAVERLTDQMDRWGAWVRNNPRQVRDFFRRTTKGAIDMAKALYQVAKALGQIGDDLLPLLTGFSQLVSGAGSLGLLQPGAFAAGLGAYRGVRGGRGGRGGGGAGGGGAAVAGAGGTMLIGGGGGRSGDRRGSFREGYRNFSQYGRRAGIAGGLGELRGGGRIRGAAVGAARGWGPMALATGVLNGAAFDGGIGGRVQAGLSAASFGLIPSPPTNAQMADEGRSMAAKHVKGLPGGVSPRGLSTARSAEMRLFGDIEDVRNVQATARKKGGADQFNLHGQTFSSKELAAYGSALKEEWQWRRQNVKQMEAQKRGRDRGKAQRFAQERFGEGFQNRAKKSGVQVAFGQTLSGVRGDFRQLGKAGDRELSKATLMWGRQMARAEPKLRGPLQRFERETIKRFHGLSKRVAFYNGQMLVGTRKEWNTISNAMGSAARRGVSEVSAEWKRLRAVALGALKDSGFSGREANSMLGRITRGNRPGADRSAQFNARGTEVIANRGGGAPRRRARGGRVWGSGTGDNTRMADGGRGAPGELIVNPHTEAAHDADARRKGLPTLAARVAGERRPNYMPVRGSDVHGGGRYFRGGRLRRGGMHWRGGSTTAFARRLASQFGLSLGSGYRSPASNAAAGGSPTSDHMKGNIANPGAWDVPVSVGDPRGDRLAAAAKAAGVPQVLWRVKDHYDHVHLGFGGGGGGSMIGGGGGGGAGIPAVAAIQLNARRSRLSGVTGALSTRAMGGIALGLEKMVNKKIGATGGGGGFSGGHGPWKQVQARIARNHHWNLGDWNTLVGKESGGNPNATNPSSGAYGLGQFLGATKQAYAKYGATSPRGQDQIRAMGRYISDRYGNPTKALAFHRAHNWYSTGGRMDHAGSFRRGGSFTTRAGNPTTFTAGDHPHRRERVTVTPIRPRRRPATFRSGGSGGGVSVQVNVTGPFHVRGDGDIEALAEKVGERAGKKVLAALQNAGQHSDQEVGN